MQEKNIVAEYAVVLLKKAKNTSVNIVKWITFTPLKCIRIVILRLQWFIKRGDPDEIIEQMAIELEDKGIEVPRKSDEIVKQYIKNF